MNRRLIDQTNFISFLVLTKQNNFCHVHWKGNEEISQKKLNKRLRFANKFFIVQLRFVYIRFIRKKSVGLNSYSNKLAKA